MMDVKLKGQSFASMVRVADIIIALASLLVRSNLIGFGVAFSDSATSRLTLEGRIISLE